MEEILGYCGYRCHLCAARSDDPEVRQRLVDGWRRLFGHENYTAENVRCDGCRSEGRHADTECKARPCAIERGVESCAACDDFPCDKMKHLMASAIGMLLWCFPKTGSLTREEYDLCMRPFDSMGELAKLLAECGRLPAWVLESDD
jgi:hypothetical protein